MMIATINTSSPSDSDPSPSSTSKKVVASDADADANASNDGKDARNVNFNLDDVNNGDQSSSTTSNNANDSSDEDNNDTVFTAITEWAKQRTRSSREVEVGAVQIEHQAPQLNVRFYRGLTRPSVIVRNRKARRERRRRRQSDEEEAGGSQEGAGAGAGDAHVNATVENTAAGERSQKGVEETTTDFVDNGNGELLISATLVEENEADVVEAMPVSFLERRWKSAAATILCLSLVLVLLAVVLPLTLTGKADNPEVDQTIADTYCSPCIKRGSYTIKVMVHGASDDYWSNFAQSARQVANCMRINLTLELYDEDHTEQDIASDIRDAASDSEVDALIVNIPSKTVATAVRYAAEKGKPVFGVGSGYDLAAESGGLIEDESLLFFTGTNEKSAGEMAASYFLNTVDGSHQDSAMQNRIAQSVAHALFITPLGIGNNSTYQKQFEGYREQLWDASNRTLNVEWVEISEPYVGNLREALSGCKYQFILVGSEAGSIARDVVYALLDNHCLQTKVGAFGMSPEIEYQLDFVIVQNAYLQGWLPVQLAAVHATTGIVPVPPRTGVYSSGPALYTKENFTLAARTTNINGRENITIGGVLHGAKDDKFWDPVFSGAFQGAKDMGVKLILERDELNLLDSNALSAKILKLCESGVDGLFVTLGDEVVADAVRKCKEQYPHIRMLSINAGYGLSRKLKLLHHIGMVERDAGFVAGKKMENMASIRKAICVNPAPEASFSVNRCAGFGEAMSELNIEYVGQINITNRDVWDEPALNAIMQDGEQSYGILLVSATIQLAAALEFKRKHGNVVLGTFDTSPELYESLQSGDVLFGIDQQPYLQGYLSVPILAHAIISGHSIDNHLIKAGPSFVTTPLTDEEANCKENNFPVCLGNADQLTISPAPTNTFQPSPALTGSPSSSVKPSYSPTFDPRPTLAIARERGHLVCGLHAETIKSGGYKVDLCRALASVLIGNSESYRNVSVTPTDRFQQLNGRSIDVLLTGDTHTVEREIMEATTGVGYSFSAPYYYDGMAYYGVNTFVRCAESTKRYDECSSIKICTLQASSSLDYLKATFPSRFFSETPTVTDMEQMLINGTCNVVASDRSLLLDVASRGDTDDANFVVGDKLMTKEPLAIVTRKNDRAFSDAINWIVQALYYGEERDLTNDASLCQKYLSLTSNVATELNFMNAVHCVGNYGEIVFDGDTQVDRGMNRINNGESGMLYAIPFGKLDREGDDEGSFESTDGSQQLERLIQAGSLDCGVVVTTGFDIDNVTSMSVAYCKTIAAALFHGNYEAVNITIFSSADAFVALDNGTVDVLASARIEQMYDFGSPSSRQGFQFSTPYYYGNESARDDMSSYSLATREDHPLFSSFINMVVLATIHAEEKGIDRSKSKEMPLVSVFGSEFAWALRDAISYSGSYDEIYTKNFGAVEKEDRGRNTLNDKGGPQLHSFPGIDGVL